MGCRHLEPIFLFSLPLAYPPTPRGTQTHQRRRSRVPCQYVNGICWLPSFPPSLPYCPPAAFSGFGCAIFSSPQYLLAASLALRVRPRPRPSVCPAPPKRIHSSSNNNWRCHPLTRARAAPQSRIPIEGHRCQSPHRWREGGREGEGRREEGR